MLIGGHWHDDGPKFAVFNPATGDGVGDAFDGGAAETAAAISAASSAFPSWSGQTAFKRAEILHQAYRLMVERKEELAQLLTQEQGKPLRAARVETQYAADFLLWFAEQAKRVYGDILPSPRVDQRFMVLRQPVGVVGACTQQRPGERANHA